MSGPLSELARLQQRRGFLKAGAMGLGAVAGRALLGASPDHALGTHHPARAKRVIFLCMAGAPSQLDLFDYKPGLAARFKEQLPPSVTNGQRVTAMTRGRTQLCAPSMFRFSRRGQSGGWWSELLPHLGQALVDGGAVPRPDRGSAARPVARRRRPQPLGRGGCCCGSCCA